MWPTAPASLRDQEGGRTGRRVPALLGRLIERFQPRLAVIACNTASTIALDHARAALAIPIVGTVPAIKPAAEMSKSRVIGVLGTDATVRQPYVDNLTAEFASDCTIVRRLGGSWVALAEAKLAGEPIDPAAVASAVRPLATTKGLDTVVLACTHFPLLAEELASALPGVAFVDGGVGIARRIAFSPKASPGRRNAAGDRAVYGRPPA